jgi:hypothetical protein
MGVLLLYVAACLTPVARIDDGIPTSDLDFKDGSPIGLVVLLFGWTGGNNGLPWSANVVLALGMLFLLLGRLRLAAVAGAVASLLGLTTWWVLRYSPLLVGYYLWQASLLLLAVGAGWAHWHTPVMREAEREWSTVP